MIGLQKKKETLEETSVKIKEMKLIGYRKTERDPKNISNKFPHSGNF